MHVQETEFNSDNYFVKNPTSRQKSYPLLNTVIPEKNVAPKMMRPSYFRSKSSIAKYSFASKISNGFTFTVKKENNHDKDSTERNLYDLKMPLKDKNNIQCLVGSEICSTDSFNPCFKSKACRREKTEQKNSCPTDSFTTSKTVSNAFEQLSLFSKFDSNQFETDICDSLPMQVDTSGSLITRYDVPCPLFQVELFRSIINDAIEEYKFAVHDAIVNLQIEMIRQMEMQKEQIRQIIQHPSVNKDMVSEVNRLRTENEKLRLKYK